MQRLPNNDKDDSRQSDGPELATDVPSEHVALLVWKAPLEVRKKLNEIMNHRNHLVISDTLNELIIEEFKRADLRIRVSQSNM